MTPRRSGWLAALLLLSGTAARGDPAPPSGVRPMPAAEAAFLRENEKAMGRMMGDMAAAPTGDVDRDFARMMIPHHQGGIDMARALLRHGHDPRMMALARAIIAKQEEEIRLMRQLSGEPAVPRPAGTTPMRMPMRAVGGGHR